MEQSTPEWPVRISPSTEEGPATCITRRPHFWNARGYDIRSIIALVYSTDFARIDFAPTIGDERYDFMVAVLEHENEEKIYTLVQQAIRDRFNLKITKEARITDVYVLSAPKGRAPAMMPVPERTEKIETGTLLIAEDRIAGRSVGMNALCGALSRRTGYIVIDETGLAGKYNFEARSDAKGNAALFDTLRHVLGLLVSPDRRTIEFLVVRAGVP